MRWSSFALLAACAHSLNFTYPSLEEVEARLHALATSSPDLVRVFTAQERWGVPSPSGTCRRGGSLVPCVHTFITITNFTSAAAGQQAQSPALAGRPQVFLHAAMNGDEWVGVPTLLYLAELLVAGASTAPGSDSFNPWLSHLVNSRVTTLLPVANPWGFDACIRTEGSVDVSRDFAFNQSLCFITTSARAINEFWRSSLPQLGIHFSGGVGSCIGYQWGAPAYWPTYRGMSDVSPDDVAQDGLARAMSAYAGLSPAGSSFEVGRTNEVIFPAFGYYNDWAYAASWDFPRMQTPCDGYDPAKTLYSDDMLRGIVIYVFTSATKIPPQEDLGVRDAPAILDGLASSNGHVPRNLRNCLALLDLVEPYVRNAPVQARAGSPQPPAPPSPAPPAPPAPPLFAGPEPCETSAACGLPYAGQYDAWVWGASPASAAWAGATLAWDVGGGLNAEATGLLVGSWDARVPPSIFWDGPPASSPGWAQAMEAFGMSGAEAAAFGAYVTAWRQFADGATSAADVPAAFLLASSPPARAPLRWSNASETHGAPRMWAAPFNATRFQACLTLGVGPQAPAYDVRFVDCSSGAQRGAGSHSAAAPKRPPLLRALLAVPYAVVDRDAFSSQPLPPAPGPAHAAHWVNARVNPAWRKANAGFTVQGRHHVTGRALMLAFTDAPRGTESPTATPSSGASPSATPPPTQSATATPTPSATATRSPSPTPSAALSASSTVSSSPSPSLARSASPSNTASQSLSGSASASASQSATPTATPAATTTRGASPSPSAAGAPAAAAAALLSTPAAAAVSVAALLAAAAAGAAWLRLRRRGGAPGSSPQEVLRPNPASASSVATLRGDVLSVWQTAADGGAGSAAAAARAAALREVLLVRGDAPLPPTPEET